MRDLLIEGGSLIVPGSRPGTVAVAAGDLATRDGIILSVAGRGDLPGDWDPSIIEASGRYVMPGLVNAHGHAAMALLRGYADDLPLEEWLEDRIWPIEDGMEGSDVEAGTSLAVAEMLLGGTTCFADMYFPMHRVAGVCSEMGIRAVLSQGLIGIDADVDRDMDYSRRFAEEWHGARGGRIRVQLGPHAPYTCPPDYLEAVVALAGELGLGIHTHLAETAGEVETIRSRYGKSPAEYFRDAGIFSVGPVTVAHAVHVDRDDLEILAADGVGVAHCPRSNLRLACGIAPTVDILEAGIPVGLGTDGPASSATLDMWEEMRFAGYLQKGIRTDARALPAEELLYMATRGGAVALGLEDVGELRPGFRADVIVVNPDRPHMVPGHDVLSSLAYCAGPGDVELVLVEGRPLVRRGHLLAADLEEIVERAHRVAVSLTERVEES